MRTYLDYLNSLTVKSLREILRQAEITGYSGKRKADLVMLVMIHVIRSRDEAYAENEARVAKLIITPFMGDVVMMEDPACTGEIVAVEKYSDRVIYGVQTLTRMIYSREGDEMRYASPDEAEAFRTDIECLNAVKAWEREEIERKAQEAEQATYVCQNCKATVLCVKQASHFEGCRETLTMPEFIRLRKLAMIKGYTLACKPISVSRNGQLVEIFMNAAAVEAWLVDCPDSITVTALLKEAVAFNYVMARKAKAIMDTYGPGTDGFDVAVQIHKDSESAAGDAERMLAWGI